MTNNGTIDATNLVIRDLLDPGLVYVAGVASEGIWSNPTWTLTTLGAGVTETLLLQVVVATGTSGQTLTNRISNTQDQLDSNATIDDDDESVVVTAVDLITVKTVNNATPQEGDVVTFSLEVTNNGPDDATNVKVIDQLPAGVTYVSDDRSGFYDPVTGVWFIGDLANGATVNLNINTTVNNGTAGSSIENVALAASGDQTDASTNGDQLSATIYVNNETDIVLSKTVDNAFPNGGDKINYTIVVENKGPIDATNIVISDVLPTGLTYVSSTPSSGVYSNSDWTMSSLTVGESETLQLEVLVSSDADGQVLTNTISNTQDQFDNNNTADDLDETIVVASADLVTQKSVDNTTPEEGDVIVYTINVRNIGPNDATNVSLIDHLPIGVTYVSDDSSGDYDFNSGVWTIPSIANGAAAILNISAAVDVGTAGKSVVNTTTAAFGDQSNSSTVGDQLEATIYVDNETDIAETKVVNNAMPNEGDVVLFTIEVQNNGPIAATNLEIMDLLPRGLTLVSGIPNQGVWSSPVWNIGTLVNGGSATLLLSAKVDEGTAGSTIVNTTTAATGDQADTSIVGDVLSATIYIDNKTDIVLSKVANNGTPNEGDEIFYTIQVSNKGTIQATNLVVEDVLPVGVTYISGTPTSGIWNNPNWNLHTLDAGETESLLLKVRIDAGTAGQSILNVISNTQDQLDTNATVDDDNETIIVSMSDLVTVKTVDNSTPDEGDTVTYTLEVSNNGPTNATNVNLIDHLPSGVTYVSDDGSGVFDSSSGVWTIGDLTFGATKVLNIQATVDAGTAGKKVTNTTTAALADQADVTTSGDVLKASIFVDNETDLQLSKVADNLTPNEGDTVVYTVTIENKGIITATNIAVTDVLPAGLTYVSAIPTTGNWSAQTWNISQLAPAAIERLLITVTVDAGTAGQILTNSVSNTQDQLDTNVSLDDLEESIVVTATDLITVKTVDNTTPSEGETISYSIEVTNNGTSDATSVSLVDILPSGVTYVGDDSGGDYNSGSGIWTIGAIANGAVKTLLIQGTVDAGTAGTTIVNSTTSANGDQADPTTTGDILEATIYVDNETDIVLSKTVNNSTPNEGEDIIYTIIVENKGTIDATNVAVTDILPSGLIYVSATPTAGSWSSPVWTISTLAPGDIEYLSLKVTVDLGTAGQSLTNTISNTQDQLDTNVSADDLDETVIVTSTDLVTIKSVDNSTPDEGEIITYTITVRNNGVSDATGVSLVDHLPQGVVYHSDDSSGAYNFGSGIWTVGDLTNGASATLNIEATVSIGSAGTTITNTTTAATGDQTDPTTIGDVLSATIHIDNETDIVLTKNVNNATPDEGDTILYSLTVTNNGAIRATNLVVTDMLPAGLIHVAGTASSGTWTYPNWAINELDPGATETLILQINVGAGTAGQTLINTVSNTQDQLDTNATPDDAEEAVTVSSTDLVTLKSVDITDPDEGDTVVYTIMVTNNGSSDATGVTLVDNLPNGVTYVSDNSGGDYNTGSGVWTIGDMLNGITRTLVINATVDGGTAGSTIVNRTTAAIGDQADPITTGDALEASIYVDNETDIVLSKVVNNTTPNEGEHVIYTIRVTNNGTIDATNLVIEDVLPAGLSYVSGIPTEGIWNAPNWSVGNLPAGDTYTLLLRVLVESGASGNSYTNTISNTQDQFDNNATPDDNEETIVVTASDLSVIKTVDNASPTELSRINYAISVTNNGPNDATGVSITDNLPSDLRYESDDSLGAYNSGSGLWTIGNLANGETKTLTITAIVRINTVGNVIINTTTDLMADQHDLDTSNNVGSVTVIPVRDVDLSLTKEFSDGTDVSALGNQKTFEIKVTNSGTSIATGVEVTDLLPSGYTFLRYTSTTGVYDHNTGLWDIGEVLPGFTVVLTMDVLVLGTGDHNNCAEITAMNENDLDSTPGNGDPLEDDYACIGVSYISSLNLGVEKTVLNNNLTPNVGDELTFKIELTNYGQLDANAVQVMDVIPVGFQYLAYKSSAGIYDSSSGIWTIGTLAKNSTEILTIAVIVNPIGDFENCATIIGSSSLDSNPVDDVSCVTVAPIAIVDLELQKQVSDNKPTAGDEIEFLVRLINKGPSIATGVTVEDVLPSGYVFVSSSASLGSYDETTGIWNVGTLQVNIEEDLTIVVKVKSTGEWDNTAQVETCNEQDIDSTPGNDNPDEDDQDTVEVDVDIDFFIPEEFTPNGDGLNDTFEITNLSVLYPNFKIVIVNRWGNKVFAYKHTGDPNTEPIWWNGYSDGGVNLGSGDVPDGTYFYTIEFNNNDRAPQTGWVYLRR